MSDFEEYPKLPKEESVPLEVKIINVASIHENDIIILKTNNPLEARELIDIRDKIKKQANVNNLAIMRLDQNDELMLMKTPVRSLKVKKLNPEAKLPTKGTEYAAGFDLFLLETVNIHPEEHLKLHTGIAVEIPPGKCGIIRPRSSAFKRGLLTIGTIDSDYRGEVFLAVQNLHAKGCYEHQQLIKHSSIAQLIIVDHNSAIKLEEVNELSETTRGTSGFGSTGNV